jgi:hypothetical protein
VQTFQRAPQLLDFPLVAGLFALGLLKRFKNFLHFLERLSQVSDDLLDVLDGLMNRGAVLARGFLVGMTLTGLVLLKSPRFVLRALMPRWTMLLRWPFLHFARLNLGLSNLLSHILLRGNILCRIDCGRFAVEWLLFRARHVDIGRWRGGGFRWCRPFGGASTSPASISSAPTPLRPPAATARATGALRTTCFLSHLFTGKLPTDCAKAMGNSPLPT